MQILYCNEPCKYFLNTWVPININVLSWINLEIILIKLKFHFKFFKKLLKYKLNYSFKIWNLKIIINILNSNTEQNYGIF